MSTRKSLPPKPDLRLFRNRAQALVNDQESKDDGAALSVADARNLIARECRFDDWDALRSAIEPASTNTARAAADKAALPPDHEFFRTVGALDLDRVRELLDQDPSLVNADVRGSASLRGDWGEGKQGDNGQWRTTRAIHFAAYGHADLLRLLIEYGTDVNAYGYEGNHQWSPPLVLACWEGSRETVRILLEAGANPNLPAIHGSSALHSAINHWDPRKIELLLRYGARHDQFSAAVVGDVEELKQQFGHYADARRQFPDYNGFINRRDMYRNRTALEWAAFRRQEEAAEYLIAVGEEITPQVAVCLGMLDKVREFVEADPAFVNRRLGADWPDPPLVWAVRSGQIEVLKYLLSVGADPNGRGAWQTMPLPLAVDLPEETALEVAKVLIAGGADPNGGRRWRSHLGEFVTKGQIAVADLLVRHGADVNKKTGRGQTTLQAMIYPPSWVERYGDPLPGIEFLLAHGADVNRLSDDGKTALDFAIEQENDTVAARLRERGAVRAEELP